MGGGVGAWLNELDVVDIYKNIKTVGHVGISSAEHLSAETI